MGGVPLAFWRDGTCTNRVPRDAYIGHGYRTCSRSAFTREYRTAGGRMRRIIRPDIPVFETTSRNFIRHFPVARG